MRKGLFRRAAAALCLLAAAVLPLGACAARPDPHGGMLPVLLAPAEGMRIQSDNPLWIQAGEDAVFRVELADGWTCITLPAGAAFDPDMGLLTLADVRFPATIRVGTWENPAACKFALDTPGGGQMHASVPQGFLYEGTPITVEAVPFSDRLFLGWSLKRSLADGGALCSEDRTYSFVLTQSTLLVANFAEIPPRSPGRWTARSSPTFGNA